MGKPSASFCMALSLLVFAGACGSTSGPSSDLASFVFDDERRTLEMHDRHKKREQLIEDCMTAQGFAYDQVQLPQDGTIAFRESVMSVEEAQQVGWGIVDDILRSVSLDPAVNPDLRENPENAGIGAAEHSEGHQEELSRALYGDDGLGGCQGEARTEVPMEMFAPQDADLLHEAMVRAESSPAYAEARAAWSRCVADQGYLGLEFGDLLDEIEAKADAIADEAGGTYPGSPVDTEALAELRELEISAAVAHATCTPVLLDVRHAQFQQEVADALELGG